MSPTRIAVVRALPGVGDLLCAGPGLAALRTAHPDADITLVGLPSAAWFVEAHPGLVDDLLPVAGVPGLPEVVPDAAEARRFYATAAARRFDLAVQVHGSGVTTNPLTTMLGAGHQVGAARPDQWQPPGTVVPYPDDVHEVLRVLAVTTASGAPSVGTDLELPLTPATRAEARRLLGGPGPAHGPYVCLHPGASRPGNRWPAACFAAVGDHLSGAGHRVVLTGSRAESPVTRAVASAMTTPVVDLAGRTSVVTLAAVFAGARSVVSNDTGAAHVAAAVHAPGVVVFHAGGDPARWAPLDRTRHHAVAPESGAGHWPTVAAVLAAVAAGPTPARAPGRSDAAGAPARPPLELL